MLLKLQPSAFFAHRLIPSAAGIEAVFAQRTSYANAMALTALTVFVVAAVVAALGPERRAARFGV